MFYSTLIARIKEVCSFPDESEATRIISGMRWIGMFSQEKVTPRQGNLLDTLCAQLEVLMKYDSGERDLVMLQHKFVVEWADGKVVRIYLYSCYFLVRLKANDLFSYTGNSHFHSRGVR